MGNTNGRRMFITIIFTLLYMFTFSIFAVVYFKAYEELNNLEDYIAVYAFIALTWFGFIFASYSSNTFFQ